MAKPQALTQQQLERREAREKRKAFWDKVWTILILTVAGLFVLWNIITTISHHI
jgi:hypothetical protein